MSEAQLSCIFEPFNRLGQEQSSTPGTGIGLVITKWLVDMMGGQLTVQSEPGQGSRFEVVLPTALAPGATATPPTLAQTAKQ
jgi:signal transduction histidine kinase